MTNASHHLEKVAHIMIDQEEICNLKLSKIPHGFSCFDSTV